MASDDEYEIALIDNETDARLCAKLISEEFCLHNPLTVYSQITPEQFFNDWMWQLMQEILDEKLSFLARHRATNEIVAVITASDLFLLGQRYLSSEDASKSASDYFMKDLSFEMCEQFIFHDFGQELKPNMVLCIIAGATRAEHAGKGIAARLRAHVCNYARNTKGFEYAFVETSNPATRHIYVKKMNGKELRIVDPATWIWKKKGDGLSCPAKDYKGEPMVNILIKLK